ncbi:hypothetical protein CC2G_014367 [Coprinopsis cinerea AmutBmut pab1-1]|nr:hypothetical protein CC2G_014367 [Coprinopsis cinerea AmutBmut pab1-1]
MPGTATKVRPSNSGQKGANRCRRDDLRSCAVVEELKGIPGSCAVFGENPGKEAVKILIHKTTGTEQGVFNLSLPPLPSTLRRSPMCGNRLPVSPMDPPQNPNLHPLREVRPPNMEPVVIDDLDFAFFRTTPFNFNAPPPTFPWPSHPLRQVPLAEQRFAFARVGAMQFMAAEESQEFVDAYIDMYLTRFSLCIPGFPDVDEEDLMNLVGDVRDRLERELRVLSGVQPWFQPPIPWKDFVKIKCGLESTEWDEMAAPILAKLDDEPGNRILATDYYESLGESTHDWRLVVLPQNREEGKGWATYRLESCRGEGESDSVSSADSICDTCTPFPSRASSPVG